MAGKKQKEITANWPAGARKIVLRNILNAYDCVIMSESKDGKYTASHQLAPATQLVISYHYEKQVFIVWNGALHRHIHNANGMTSLSMGSNAKGLLDCGFDESRIECTYKNIGQDGYRDCVEMVVVVGKAALLEFCKHADSYILPNVTTIPRGKHCLFARPNCDLEKIDATQAQTWVIAREREIISRAKRKADFRDRVLELWGKRCIVCGATEEKLLEAAHKESVRSGGSDDPSNGYCLCANHHRLYDAAMLDIDLPRGTFACNSEAAKAMPWYGSAGERGYRLFLPDEQL